MTQILSGGCQCGQVRYKIAGPPLRLFICHCRECRKQSASAFGISVIVRSADLRLLQGHLERWSRKTESGQTLTCFFCSACGSRVWHGDKETFETVSIKGGSLDDPVDLSSAVHIWTSGKLPSIIIPEHALQFPEEPS